MGSFSFSHKPKGNNKLSCWSFTRHVQANANGQSFVPAIVIGMRHLLPFTIGSAIAYFFRLSCLSADQLDFMTFSSVSLAFAKTCRIWKRPTEWWCGGYRTSAGGCAKPRRGKRPRCIRLPFTPIQPGTRSALVSIPTETALAKALTCRCSLWWWRETSTPFFLGLFVRKSAWCFSTKARPTQDMSWKPSAQICVARPSNVLSKKWTWPRDVHCSIHSPLWTTPPICKMTRSSGLKIVVHQNGLQGPD